MYTHNVTPEAISKVKRLIKEGLSIRRAAASAGISYYSAYISLNGKIKKQCAEDGYFDYKNKCVITGFYLHEKY